ncbi:MAG: nickel pincer cofactor biosynthesis protein LarB [Armatimonadetes bacterium]|nr:nickel pincer cofactor biosynthesis protein LarB [Armatimonadota bacterium]
MNADHVKDILARVQAGTLTADEAFAALKWAPYEDLGYARVDTHRRLRTGTPEVIYCEGKSPEQVAGIVDRLAEHHGFVLATRAAAAHFAAVAERHPQAVYHHPARLIEIRHGPRPAPPEDHPPILVISGGTSDLPVAEEAAVTAECLGNRVERLYDCGVAGLHRLLDDRQRLDEAGVMIVVAGMEGALASVVGGMVEQPVIAVPTSVGYGASFQGLAALLSMLNSCAAGIAVVNIDNGFGAGYFAHLINRAGERTSEKRSGERVDQPQINADG